MQVKSSVKCCAVLVCCLLMVTHLTSATSSYSDYENVRDLYELLLQKEALENRLGQHEVVRKSNRSPSLRLRFGRRADPSIAAAAFADHSSIEVPSEN